MTCPLIDEESRLFSEKRGLHRMFSLGTKWRPHVRRKIKNGYGVLLESMTAVMTWLPLENHSQTEAAVTDKGKCLTFFLFGKLSKPIMMGDGNRRGAAEYVQSYSSSKGGWTTLHHTFYLDNRCDAAVVERKTHAKISWERVFFVTQENEEFSALSDKNAKKKS